MNPASILIVDADAARARELLAILEFTEQHAAIVAAAELAEAIDPRGLSQLYLGRGGDDAALLARAREARGRLAQLPIVVVEDDDSAPLPAAFDHLGMLRLYRPFRQGALNQLMMRIAEFRRSVAETAPRQPRRHPELFRVLVGQSRPIAAVRSLIERVAPTEATVLVLGESGTGKEVVARNLHYHSARQKGPFVPVNCGAIPENLLESELFGHEKGAFTGAITARRGRFELAEGGTLFLDEIGDMPLAMQVKLLRVLQERSFERVGGNKAIQADVRIVAATHRKLEQLITDGRFREDLYYRLNVFPIEMPPLRERIGDLPLLIDDLIRRQEAQSGVRLAITPAAMRCLAGYAWPGNVRELANLMERLAILRGDGVVDVPDLPPKFREGAREIPEHVSPVLDQHCEPVQALPEVGDQVLLPEGGLDLRQYLAELEIRLIQSALDEAHGVVAHAATLLKMRRTTLVEKIRKYGLRGDDDSSQE